MDKTPHTPGQSSPRYEVKSPDGRITLHLEVGDKLQWAVQYAGEPILLPSPVSIQLESGETLGESCSVKSCEARSIDSEFQAINYRKSVVKDQHTQLLVQLADDYGIEFRVYNDAVAYRFWIRRPGQLTVRNEEANFIFAADHLVVSQSE
jgi:alpha-glucosidase